MLDGTPFQAQHSLFSGDLLFIGGAGNICVSVCFELLTHRYVQGKGKVGKGKCGFV